MSTQNDGAAPRGEDAETAPAASSVPEVAADPFGATSVLFKAPDIEELKAAALAKKQQEKAELEAAEDEPQDDGEVVARKRRRRRRKRHSSSRSKFNYTCAIYIIYITICVH